MSMRNHDKQRAINKQLDNCHSPRGIYMAEKGPDRFVRCISLINLIALILGGVWVYWKVTKPLADVQRRLLDTETQQRQIELQPALSIKPEINDHHISKESRQGDLQVVISNIGKVPVRLGKIQFRVYFQSADTKVTSLFAPQASDFTIRDEFSVTRPNDGQMFRLPWYDGKRIAMDELTENRKLDLTMSPGQAYSLYYNYVLVESLQPKWYLIEAVLFPKEGDTSWLPLTYTWPIPGHHIPTWEPATYGRMTTSNSEQHVVDDKQKVNVYKVPYESYRFSPIGLTPAQEVVVP
jgi:hypothetical protein